MRDIATPAPSAAKGKVPDACKRKNKGPVLTAQLVLDDISRDLRADERGVLKQLGPGKRADK